MTVDRAAELMPAEDIGRVPVVDEASVLVGLLARWGWRREERERVRFTRRGIASA